MQMEFAARRGPLRWIGGEGKRQTAQTHRNQRRGGPLATPHQEIAAAEVPQIMTRRRSTGRRIFPARPRLTPLGHSGVKPKLTPWSKPVKVATPPGRESLPSLLQA